MKTEQKYEVGGRVQISGKWYEIVSRDIGGAPLIDLRDGIGPVGFHGQFIQDYEPPKKEVVHEWFGAGQWVDMIAYPDGKVHRSSANAKLSKLYGSPPVVRTYNGEEAWEFGLKRDSSVLSWYDGRWLQALFQNLDFGEKWMLQPPAPKEDK